MIHTSSYSTRAEGVQSAGRLNLLPSVALPFIGTTASFGGVVLGALLLPAAVLSNGLVVAAERIVAAMPQVSVVPNFH